MPSLSDAPVQKQHLPTSFLLLAGLAISNSDAIREVHNSFTPPHALLPEIPDEDDEKGEAFHFVAYTWRSGAVWELDGLQQGPICLGECAEVGSLVEGSVRCLQGPRRALLYDAVDASGSSF